jgi:mono/diheme cytochrome c family protein
MRARSYLVLAGIALAACGGQRAVDRALERMREQPRYHVYGASGVFADGKSMQVPPEGTVSREEVLDRTLTTGRDQVGRYAADLPAAVADRLLDRGRTRFRIFCAACHGAGGWGGSIVAENMTERRPPSLHDPAITGLPPGRLYEIVRDGFGRMPSYAGELSVEDRWAVVAYARALAVRTPADSMERADSLRGAQLRRLDSLGTAAGRAGP